MTIDVQEGALIVQTIGIIIGAIFIVRQIDTSGKIRRDGDRDKLRLEIYREITKGKKEVMSAALDLKSLVRRLLTELEYTNNNINLPMSKGISVLRASDIFDVRNILTGKNIALMGLIESYEKVEPKLFLFNFAFSSKGYDLNNPTEVLFLLIAPVLPLDNPGVTYPVNLVEIKKVVKQIEEICDDISCFAHDLGVETQNLMLGGLFEYQVERREPLDPKHLVIRLDNYEVLKKYFEEETEQGKSNKEAMKRAKLELG